MIKAGIFLDVENLKRCGGWGMRFEIVRKLVEAQGCTVIRANAYLVKDVEKEERDLECRFRQDKLRDAFRASGFHLVVKPIQKFRGEDGEVVIKGNTDMEMAVDALTQSENLDYILVGSGDGDFLRIVRALQMRGKRVDVLSFLTSHTSTELRHEADWYINGALVPGLLPMSDKQPGRYRGVIYNVTRDGYGFIKYWEGLSQASVVNSVFFHFSDFVNPNNYALTADLFLNMQKYQVALEFELVRKKDGNLVAKDIHEYRPSPWGDRSPTVIVRNPFTGAESGEASEEANSTELQNEQSSEASMTE